MSRAADVIQDLMKASSADRAKASLWFFKTGKGEYGENDKFIGVSVPDQRKVARKHLNLSLAEMGKLLKSPVHEYRLTSLFILNSIYKREKNNTAKKRFVDFYLRHKDYVNNWDLVDSSAPYILGPYLIDKPKTVLYNLVKSKSIWHRRIAIISTQYFIRNNKFADTLKLSRTLLFDTHDLIHKAVGWMLREVGNRNLKTELLFLNRYYRKMPRTMLRYAIEKFPARLKKKYMAK